MKTKEKLERSGWVFDSYLSYLEVYTRDEKFLWLNPNTNKIEMVKDEKYFYVPTETDVDILCEKQKVKRKMIYAHF